MNSVLGAHLTVSKTLYKLGQDLILYKLRRYNMLGFK